MSLTVFCLVALEAQAQAITQRLHDHGIGADKISVLIPKSDGSGGLSSDSVNVADQDFTQAATILKEVGTNGLAGAGTGSVIGGTLGWMLGIGLVAIPGIGPVFAAGPLIALIAGVAVGASVGGMTGALIGFGLPEPVAQRYEEKVKTGRIFISVQASDDDEVEKIVQIFTEFNAEDISSPTASGLEPLAGPVRL